MDNEVHRFGKVEFVPGKRRLSVDGRGIDLDRPAASILSLLLHENESDVEKNRLLDAGWPGRVVDENSLAKAICRLRTALGEDGAALETVHGYGYRISAGVVTEQLTAGPARPFRATALGVAVSCVAAAFLAAGAWQASQSAGEDAAPRVINGEAADSVGRILWVDDHPENNVAERRFLEQHKIGVYEVATTDDALKLLEMYAYGAVVSDMGRNDNPLAGIDLLEAMRERGDNRPFILYTVHSSKAQRKLLADSGGQVVADDPRELYEALFPLFGSRLATSRVDHLTHQ
ncbi:MAG TPA: winged helix-turn-helix domain-containing protein [Sphingomicrobium sp.]|nr:winged helix-turn-helix domain-containing protein [Sphingomicrobium sp.]